MFFTVQLVIPHLYKWLYEIPQIVELEYIQNKNFQDSTGNQENPSIRILFLLILTKSPLDC